MLNGYIYTSALFALFFIILGLLVFLRNSKQLVNRQFLAFSTFIALWLVTNFLSGTTTVPINIAAPANHLVLAFGVAWAAALVMFITTFSESKSKLASPLLFLNSIASLLCLTNLVIDKVAVKGGTYVLHFGSLSSFYFLMLFLDLVMFIVILLRGYRRSKGLLRVQLGTIFFSFAVTLTGITITNAVLPSVFNYYVLTNAGSLLSVVLVAGVAYTIIKHKLFDIRLVVARSLAYVLVVGVLGIGYSVLSFTIVSRLVENNGRAVNVFVNTVLIVIAAITFTPLKTFFDKITNRFFYQDAYDSQAFLDNFNKTLVSTYDLNDLLHKSAIIIEQNIKSTYVLFGIKETAEAPRRLVGAGNKPTFSEADIALVRKITPKLGRKVILADALEPKYADFQQLLLANDIAIMLRLAAKNNEEGAGYLILGPKKSGNVYSSRDINILEIIANELVIAIQNALRFEEIQTFNITLQEKVNDATHKLRRTNEKLKQLDESKDDFISMASHQLRTPLTSVKGYISMVLEEDAGKITATQREMLGQAFFSSQRMVYLIADLLNVSRLKTGKFVMEPVKVNLASMIEQEMHQLEESAAARNLSLRFDKPANFPDTILDETKTRQVIMNFIDNAIYYTKAGGRIRVILSETASTIEMRVEDDGIGVPKHEIPHLFTKFYRAVNARQARPDGTGLGLYMAKKVIMGQGGSVIFESVEGQGSVFGFVFSKAAVGISPGVRKLVPVKPPEIAAVIK